MLLTIACMLQAVINETGTLPVPCRRFKMNGVMSLNPGNKGEQSQPALAGVYQRIMGSDCKHHKKHGKNKRHLELQRIAAILVFIDRFRHGRTLPPGMQEPRRPGSNRQTLSANTDKWLSKPLY